MNDTIEHVRAFIQHEGAEGLLIDDLRRDDLALLSWSGTPLHIESVAKALDRVASGEVDYLVVRAPDGMPIAKGGLDHRDERGPGKLWQLATHSELQGLGIGTRLIGALEARVQARGLASAWLGVEPENPARRLYEQLGYVAFDEQMDGWETQNADGRRYWKETLLVLMRHTF